MVSLWSHRELLNPVSHGLYGLRLAINKGLRRLLPVGLVQLFPATVGLWNVHAAFPVLVGLQGLFYLTAAAYPISPSRWQNTRLMRPAEMAFYFCAGNVGTMLGLWDYLRGRRYVTWEPRDARTGAGDGKGER
jgi:hypothetical protein